jgi:hypothetical protein
MNHSEAKTAHMALVRSAVESAPLATLGECEEFLAWVIGRIEQFDRDQPSLDLRSVIDALSDAEAVLQCVEPNDPAEMAALRSEHFKDEVRREERRVS